MAEAIIATLPAPVGGLNLRDNASELPPEDALELINLFPEASEGALRGGTEEYIAAAAAPSGVGTDAVDTLAPLIRGASEFMIAGTDNKFYNVTTSTPSDITGAATITNDVWSFVEFDDSDAPNQPELLMVNGDDAPLEWAGSGNVAAWTFYDYNAGTPQAFTTNPALTDFIGIQVYKNRVFLWAKGSRDFWFGFLGQKPGTAAGDALTRFPLSAVRGTQGNIVAMETWTRDAGDGPDDYLVIITDRGSAIVYAGTDPGDASAWLLVGIYTIPPPVGRRAVTKILDDIAIVTESDVVLLSQAIRTQGIAGAQSKVAPWIADAVSNYGSNTGWQMIMFPKKNRAYINVPTGAAMAKQMVMNTRTLAFCEYQGWEARTFAVYKGDLYYGDGAGAIFRAETGRDDNGNGYLFRWSTGFLRLGKPGWKQLQAMRPVWALSDDMAVGYAVNTDFKINRPSPPASTGNSSVWTWGGGLTWAQIKWNTLNNTSFRQEWLILEGGGEYLGISLAGEPNDISASLYSVNLAWTPGTGW